MSALGKIISVEAADDLLDLFAQVYDPELTAEYSIKLQRVPQGPVATLQTPAGLIELPVHPRLHASRQWLKAVPVEASSSWGLLLSPHVPEALAADLRRAGIAHADLNGRLFLKLPGLLIDRTPRAFRYQAPVFGADPFALKTSRLVRAMLAGRERSWTQAELVQRTRLSRGLVSRVLGGLVEEDLIAREGAGSRLGAARYSLNAFGPLLDAWKNADSWSGRCRVQQYSVLGDDAHALATQVREQLRDKEGKTTGVFTQWFAARLRYPYTDGPVVSVYVRDFPEPTVLKARAVPSGGNLWLIKPRDEGVFLETQEVAGFPLVCDAQIYLDLLQVSQRGPEQAEVLRDWEGFAR